MHFLLFLFETAILFAITLLNSLGLGTTETVSEAPAPPTVIQKYEYGAHVPGEKKSFKYLGTIPALDVVHTLNITPTTEGLEKRYTYMRVEYVNAVSKVIVNFEHKTNILTLTVVFPFIETKFGVIGYSMPLVQALRETEPEIQPQTEELSLKNE